MSLVCLLLWQFTQISSTDSGHKLKRVFLNEEINVTVADKRTYISYKIKYFVQVYCLFVHQSPRWRKTNIWPRCWRIDFRHAPSLSTSHFQMTDVRLSINQASINWCLKKYDVVKWNNKPWQKIKWTKHLTTYSLKTWHIIIIRIRV